MQLVVAGAMVMTQEYIHISYFETSPCSKGASKKHIRSRDDIIRAQYYQGDCLVTATKN